MAIEILSKDQRNTLFSAVGASGLPRDDFSFGTIPSFSGRPDEAWVKHVPSDSRFTIIRDRDASVFTVNLRVGTDPTVTINSPMNFTEVAERVRGWGMVVADWLDTPDLWESKPEPAAIPGELSPESANTPFTRDEQAAISAQLKEIAESIKKTYDLTDEQSAKLDEKFTEADKASRRMGRKDWGTFLGGIALSLVLADVITPDVMGHIFTLIEHGLGHLFTGGTSVRGIMSTGQD